MQKLIGGGGVAGVLHEHLFDPGCSFWQLHLKSLEQLNVWNINVCNANKYTQVQYVAFDGFQLTGRKLYSMKMLLTYKMWQAHSTDLVPYILKQKVHGPSYISDR